MTAPAPEDAGEPLQVRGTRTSAHGTVVPGAGTGHSSPEPLAGHTLLQTSADAGTVQPH